MYNYCIGVIQDKIGLLKKKSQEKILHRLVMTLTIHLKVTTNPLPKGSSTVLRKTGTRGEELWSKTGFSDKHNLCEV